MEYILMSRPFWDIFMGVKVHQEKNYWMSVIVLVLLHFAISKQNQIKTWSKDCNIILDKIRGKNQKLRLGQTWPPASEASCAMCNRPHIFHRRLFSCPWRIATKVSHHRTILPFYTLVDFKTKNEQFTQCNLLLESHAESPVAGSWAGINLTPV